MQIESAWISSPVDDGLICFKVVGDDATYAITLSNGGPWDEQQMCLLDWLGSNQPGAFTPPPPRPAAEKLQQLLEDYGLTKDELIGALK